MKKYILPLALVAVVFFFISVQAVLPHLYRNIIGVHLTKAWHLFLYLLVWLAAYFAGRTVLKVLGIRENVPGEVAVVAGVVVFANLAFAAAALRVAYGWLIKAVTVAVLIIGGGKDWVRLAKWAAAALRRWREWLEPGTAGWLFVASVFAVPMALAAAQPPIYWDALTYHLAVPYRYAENHGFVYLPHNVYASMPLGATMFYLWAMLWDGLICANACYLGVSLVVIVLTYRLARLWLEGFYAAAAAALVFFTSVFFTVMPGAHVDHFLMAFVLGGLYTYLAGDGSGPLTPARAAAIGLFWGAALAVKYTSVYVVGAFAPVLIYDLWRRKLKLAVAALAVAVMFILVAPWLVKACVERGNPFFPLFYGFFGGKDFAAWQARRLVEWQYGMGAGRGFVDYLLLPWRISVNADFSYEGFAGIYLPYLLPLAAMAIWFFRRGWKLVTFGWGFFVFWALGPQQLRFLDPGLPAFAVAAAAVLTVPESYFGAKLRAGWRLFLWVLITFTGVSYNTGAVVHTLEGYDYFAGQDRERFLAEKCGFYLAQKFINERTPRDAKVLMVFTNHTLYLRREAVYDSFFETSPFLAAAARPGACPEDLYRLARRWGVTHIHVFHMFEEKTWPYYGREAKSVFYEFLSVYGRPIYRDPLNDVYELVAGKD